MRQWEYLKFMIGRTFCFLEFRLDFFKWLPQKSKHIQILLRADRSSKSICKPFFWWVFFLARTLISAWAACNAPRDFQWCCEETQRRKQQDSAVEGGIVFVWELLKYVYKKAVTWVAFSQNLECKRILQFFNKTGEEWCHGRGFPGVWCLWMINM